MEFSSISNVTSIYGTPFFAAGMELKSNRPRLWLSFVRARSPSNTPIDTVVCESSFVENIYDFLVGIRVPLGIILVITLPAVSIPNVRGVASRIATSLVSGSPARIAA